MDTLNQESIEYRRISLAKMEDASILVRQVEDVGLSVVVIALVIIGSAVVNALLAISTSIDGLRNDGRH